MWDSAASHLHSYTQRSHTSLWLVGGQVGGGDSDDDDDDDEEKYEEAGIWWRRTGIELLYKKIPVIVMNRTQKNS